MDAGRALVHLGDRHAWRPGPPRPAVLDRPDDGAGGDLGLGDRHAQQAHDRERHHEAPGEFASHGHCAPSLRHRSSAPRGRLEGGGPFVGPLDGINRTNELNCRRIRTSPASQRRSSQPLPGLCSSERGPHNRAHRVESPRRSAAGHGYPQAGQHGRIVHTIGRRIVTGEIRPGEQLPTPARVRASRGVVREAVKVLAAKGLVVSRPKTGTRVRPPESWNLLDPDVLAWRQEGLPRGRLPGQAHRGEADHRAGAAELAARRAGPAQVRVAAARAARHARCARPLAPGLRGLQRGGRPLPPHHRAGLRQRRSRADGRDREHGAARRRSTPPSASRVWPAASLPRHQAILDAIRRRQPNRARAAMSRLVHNTGRSIGKLRS